MDSRASLSCCSGERERERERCQNTIERGQYLKVYYYYVYTPLLASLSRAVRGVPPRQLSEWSSEHQGSSLLFNTTYNALYYGNVGIGGIVRYCTVK